MLDFKKLCADYNIPYWESGKNVAEGWINVQCPFCDDESNHLGFSPEGRFNCWKCGSKHPNQVIEALCDVPYYQAQSVFIKYNTSPRFHLFHEREKVKGAEKLELPTPEKRMNITAKSYLAHRGFNPEKLEQKYKIFIGSYLNRDYKFRIIIPIIYEEKPVSFIGRDYTGKQIPKYKCPKREQEVIHHKDILYNLDNCDKDFCIVVEGVFDCWKIGDDCCATFGTSWSEKQAILLSKRFNKICILYDNDETGVSKGSLLKGFLEMCGVQVIQIMSTENSKNDPGEYTEKEARKVKRRIIHILQNI